jgi:hypothetical protein
MLVTCIGGPKDRERLHIEFPPRLYYQFVVPQRRATPLWSKSVAPTAENAVETTEYRTKQIRVGDIMYYVLVHADLSMPGAINEPLCGYLRASTPAVRRDPHTGLSGQTGPG